MSRTAILMLNMGGPSTVPETLHFLTNLFSDTDLIPLPFQNLLAPFIARRRSPKIEKQYQQIGGGSPILPYTNLQATSMASLLDQLNPQSAPHKPYIAFRYAHPLTHATLRDMKADGVQRAVVFSQYPQYSCSTTGSSLNELFRQAQGASIEWSVIDRWGTHPGFIDVRPFFFPFPFYPYYYPSGSSSKYKNSSLKISLSKSHCPFIFRSLFTHVSRQSR